MYTQIKLVDDNISKADADIRSTLEKLDKCQSESDKAHFQSEIKLLREKENLLRKEKEQLREQLRPTGIKIAYTPYKHGTIH